ncbi:arrestin domain-containing protein 3 isoform X2 [Drosophila busckii]|uniref:arrestin domain-containing protein 3 isoform X2 n=1 Tax=Drosophila busckii TaxID=30019 RepID=UPI00083F03CC|nr:arrestin domain-containing protein 3 isoform X2 [Drosophila busckii]
MVLSCEIQFNDNPLGTYFAGQTVLGRVIINTDKQSLVKAVVLKIRGYASTYWTESTTDSENKSETDEYTGHEDYIRSKVELLSAVGTAIAPGCHVYNFSCQLPTACPSSFEGSHGCVRYMITVKLIRPWKLDKTFSRAFTVLKVMDLNRDELLLRSPAHAESQKTYNCWPCNSEPLLLRLSLPHRGFVPGQSIPLDVLVANDSHIQVKEIKARLIMMVVYYCQNRMGTNNDRVVVSRKTGEGVHRSSKKQFTFELRVPATPPTCFDLCSIIQIGYQVEVEVKVKGWHINERLHLPVTIGNVPLTNKLIQQPRSVAYEVQVPLQQVDEKALVLVEAPNAALALPSPNPWAADDSIPPPTYAEAMHSSAAPAKRSSEEDTQSCIFKPLYTVFNISSPLDNGQCVTTRNGLAHEDVDRSTWF